MGCSGLGAIHLGIFPARATIWGIIHQVILLGKYIIWGGIHGRKPRRTGTALTKYMANFLLGIAGDLPAQMGWRLGGQGAWHIGADPPGGLAPRCPAICPYKRAGFRAVMCPYIQVGAWAVREPGTSGLIRPGSLAPACPAICPYKRGWVWVVQEPGISRPMGTGALA